MPAAATTHASTHDTTPLDRGLDALISLQRDDGSWEGECVWNPMLAAQYAIASHIMKQRLSQERRRGLLTQFRVTRHRSGLWGLHPHDEGNLYVTTLVYVAARILGAPAETAWLKDARHLFATERVERIPTWGKVWLAALGLYDWDGVNPIVPEAWALPNWIPLHPSNYYCHTRQIYLGLAVLFGRRFIAERKPVINELENELYGERFARVPFARYRNDIRPEDAPFSAGPALRAVFAVARAYDRVHSRRLRRSLTTRLVDDMRAHLDASDYLGLSPVNGLLIMLALWAENPEDPHLERARSRFEDWFWEDANEGSRVAGAGSVCWDTAFALQALSEVARVDCSEPISRSAAFLASQQVATADYDYQAAHRIQPDGGWCFSEVGHGWPVSDCTAEALIGLLRTRPEAIGKENAARAARFMLRCQNRDGGFGSYEPAKTRFPLEWMNPAEMFGRCMTERSYVECTASCLIALCDLRRHYPDLMRVRLDGAIDRASALLRRVQNDDGAWDAAWGVHFIYGTMFGVRGLLAAGVPPTDAHVRDACGWLLSQQRSDGGWGEDYTSGPRRGYVQASQASVIQTAWALITLIEADEPDRRAIDRAAAWLEQRQQPSGLWEGDEFVGVFFETALLNYRLYRQYFPVMALALNHRADRGPDSGRRLS
ncbi:MAG: prenyltransferase/squalene oxidase repeat-containing protein [Myxococcota bacterium]